MEKQYSSLIPYIKPTRRKHSSGYNVFECGYLDKSEGAICLVSPQTTLN